MTLPLYCVYDTVAQEARAPFPAKNDILARRMFDEWKDQSKVKYPADYKLFKLGRFDFDTMDLSGLGRAVELVLGDGSVE